MKHYLSLDEYNLIYAYHLGIIDFFQYLEMSRKLV